MDTFDINHFFETRQEIASNMRGLEPQRRVAEIRQTIQQDKLKEAAQKTTKKEGK